MNFKYILFFILIAFIFIFPAKVSADDKYGVYYYLSDDVYGEMGYDEYVFCGEFTFAEKVFAVIDNLFDNKHKTINFIPTGIRLISVKCSDGYVVIDVSGDILSYGGGSTMEIGLVRQILYNAFQFDDTEYLTVLIDGKIQCLPEGTKIYKYTKEEFKDLCEVFKNE